MAISGAAPPFSAVTHLPLALAFRLTLPSAFGTIWNSSQSPMPSRFAMRAEAPPFSAVTYRPLASDRSATYPPPASTTSNRSQ